MLQEAHHATNEYDTLIRDIEAFGLEAEVRHGYGTTLIILVRIPRNQLGNEVYRSRVKDWLFGIVHVRPLGDSSTVVDAATPSEEIRSVFHLVTWTKEQGGTGITANFGQWKHVTASFAPHAWTANKNLLKQLSAKFILEADDLDQIKALFGEKVRKRSISTGSNATDWYAGSVLLCLHTSLFPLSYRACFVRDIVLAFLKTILDRVRSSHMYLEHYIC